MTFRVVVKLKALKEDWILRQASFIQARRLHDALDRLKEDRELRNQYEKGKNAVVPTPWRNPYQQVQPPHHCAKCGLDLAKTTGYVCSTHGRPTGLGSTWS